MTNEGQVYPHFPINDKEGKVLGSCSCYNDRIDVTNLVKSYTLDQAEL